MRYLTLFLFALLTFLSGCSDNPTSESESENINEPAPNFTLTSLADQQITLSNLEGKVVYLFFLGANCPHCRDNGPVTENKIYQPFKDNPNFVALGLDTWNTSAASVQNFKEVTGISYSLLLNARQTLVDYYGSASDYDRSVVIAADGTIAYQGTEFVNKDSDTVVSVIEEEINKLSE